VQVETLFHEFGHGLQHMLTTQEEGTVAGISNVEWDAVELPSQFMENWCYHRYHSLHYLLENSLQYCSRVLLYNCGRSS